MNDIRTAVRRALGRASRLPTRLARAGHRPLAALAIAAAVLTTPLVPPTAARAEAPIDSAIRLQVVLKKVHIFNDHDWGAGELKLYAGFYAGDGVVAYDTPSIASMSRAAFSANSGDDVALERVFPWEGDTMGPGVDRHTGMPLMAGNVYQFVAEMGESDGPFSADDDLGALSFRLSEQNSWGIGTHTIRSTRSNGSPADFELTFEIRTAPLPDLTPVAIKVLDLPASTRELLCATVLNNGIANPGPFEATFRIDGNVPPGGKATAGQLVSGTSGDLCIETDVPDIGPHRLSAYVDESRTVTEVSELNNFLDQPYTAPLQPTSTSSQPAPTSAGQGDLTISAIKVNGQVPDGKDDCKDGKSAVTVVFKNVGAALVGDSAVRLVVDDARGTAIEQAVGEIEAGQEREVHFEDVRLKKGQHKLTATVDPNGAITEANEENNARTVTVACRDGN